MYYMNSLVNFEFIPLEAKRILNYGKGIANAYQKKINQLENNYTSAIKNPNHPQYSKYRNYERGMKYATSISKKTSTDAITPGGQIDRVIPTVTTVNGRKISVGLRHMTGIKNKTINEIFGATTTHPKYKNYGATSIFETMIDHAGKNPDENHYISGANKALGRLYRQKAKNYDLPSNLIIDNYDYDQYGIGDAK